MGLQQLLGYGRTIGNKLFSDERDVGYARAIAWGNRTYMSSTMSGRDIVHCEPYHDTVNRDDFLVTQCDGHDKVAHRFVRKEGDLYHHFERRLA